MKTITVHDAFQKNYTYKLSAPRGRNYDPEFKPELTPPQMLKMGIFGGTYFPDSPSEFPASWFRGVPISLYKPNPKLNFYKVNASQPLKVWQAKGWIYANDPRGWFQWYCRYYMGRRILAEDRRQIKRWKAIQRHIKAVQKKLQKRRPRMSTSPAPSDLALGLRLAQTLKLKLKFAC